MNDTGKILWASNELSSTFRRADERVERAEFMSLERCEAARKFLASVPGYEPTPIARLPRLGELLGAGEIFVKDESKRFGMNAFKSLGALWASANVAARALGMSEPTCAELASSASREAMARTTFITATDGNHGRAVARAARILGANAVVYMPRGSSRARVDAISREGADVSVMDALYDECVDMASRDADANGWTLVQDTSRDGYTEIPEMIMQGYATIILEAAEQMGEPPTHMILQAGVGSFAAAIAACSRELFADHPPKIVVAEPSHADCFYRTAAANDGMPRRSEGPLDTMMAGLACGVPSPIALDILRQTASVFTSCPDEISACGMRVLASPLEGDDAVVSGESGAIGAGLMVAMRTDIQLSALKVMLGISSRSRVLLISTEGDTDPLNYRRIVWGGEMPTPIDSLF